MIIAERKMTHSDDSALKMIDVDGAIVHNTFCTEHESGCCYHWSPPQDSRLREMIEQTMEPVRMLRDSDSSAWSPVTSVWPGCSQAVPGQSRERLTQHGHCTALHW